MSNTSNWLGGDAGARFPASSGDTTLTSAWAQDTWRIAPQQKAVLGARLERWHAFKGSIADASASAPRPFAERIETHVSPKAALSFSPTDLWAFRGSAGRAVRMPTVAELYQGSRT